MPSVLITGANRGIGLGFARAYADDGWRVIATCRAPQAASELNHVAAAAPGRVSVDGLDVTDGEAVHGLAEKLDGEVIDVLIHNAGVGEPSYSFGSTDYAAWQHVLDVNTLGAQRMAEAFVEHVARSDRKLMVGISSGMGSIADNSSGGYIAYRSSKAALDMVMRTLAIDLGPRGIIAVAINPGWVKTDMGGRGGTMTVDESVRRMRTVLARLTLADSGKFWHHSGKEFPW